MHRETGQALERLLSVVVNKQEAGDFTEREWQEFTRDLHKLLDLEHTIETLKVALGERGWCGMEVTIEAQGSAVLLKDEQSEHVIYLEKEAVEV